jgi:hypothetical protein
MTSIPKNPTTLLSSGIRGKPVSGRTWKMTRKKVSSLTRTGPLKQTWEEKIQQRTSMKLLKDHEKEMKQEKQLELEKVREKRLQNQKQREINNLRSEQYQVVRADHEWGEDSTIYCRLCCHLSDFRIISIRLGEFMRHVSYLLSNILHHSDKKAIQTYLLLCLFFSFSPLV